MKDLNLLGQTVLYGLSEDENGGVVERPAIVVRHDAGTGVNLQVLTDGSNDDRFLQVAERSVAVGVDVPSRGHRADRVVWRTSVSLGTSLYKPQALAWRPLPGSELEAELVGLTLIPEVGKDVAPSASPAS